MSLAYREAGVDLDLGNQTSRMLYEASKLTWANREGVFGELTAALDSFSGLRSMQIAPLLAIGDPRQLSVLMADDGIGTKVEVAERVGDYTTVAHDLLAMVCDDAVIKGFEPVAVTTTFNVNTLGNKNDPQQVESLREQVRQAATGYVTAANLARVAIVNGEVAELGDLVGGYVPGEGDGRRPEDILRFEWSATLMSVGHKRRLLDGRRIKSGDALVGFGEEGFRSNGLSLVRKTYERAFGPEWHKTYIFSVGMTLGRAVLRPSTIYTPVVTDAFGGYDTRQRPKSRPHGAAHITGGGLPEKLARMLEASGLGADISAPFEPGNVLQVTQRHAQLPDKEAYMVWNMGQGMVVATDKPEATIKLAAKHGVAAQVIGEVTAKPGVRIRSAGQEKPGKKLQYR